MALVLDSQGLSVLARAVRGPQLRLAHDLLTVALESATPVVVPTAVLVEQYRGTKHDAAIDALLARHRAAVVLVDTSKDIARAAGHLLAEHRLGSAHHVDALVVATAATYGAAAILPGDPVAIRRLSRGMPLIRVIEI